MAMTVTAVTSRHMDKTLTFNSNLGTPIHSFMSTLHICPLSTYLFNTWTKCSARDFLKAQLEKKSSRCRLLGQMARSLRTHRESATSYIPCPVHHAPGNTEPRLTLLLHPHLFSGWGERAHAFLSRKNEKINTTVVVVDQGALFLQNWYPQKIPAHMLTTPNKSTTHSMRDAHCTR